MVASDLQVYNIFTVEAIHVLQILCNVNVSKCIQQYYGYNLLKTPNVKVCWSVYWELNEHNNEIYNTKPFPMLNVMD